MASTSTITLQWIDGHPYPNFMTKERLEVLSKIPLFEDDIFIVTYPKNGTTWMQQIVRLIQSDGILDPAADLKRAIPWIEEMEGSENNKTPRTFKSHNLYSKMAGGEPAVSPCKYIYVARNPKDTAVSLFYHIKGIKSFNFEGDWNCFFELYMTGDVESGLWFDHVLPWWEKSKAAPNILFVKYEDMQKDIREVIKRVAQFIGHDEPDNTLMEAIVEQSTFKSMKDNQVFVPRPGSRKEGSEHLRKGVVGDWRNHFSEEQSARFDTLYEKRMAGTGLSFEFN